MATDHVLTRRSIIAAAGAAAGALALSACSGGDGPGTTPAGDAGTSADAGTAAAGSPTKPLAELADIPVGGAVSATSSDGGPIIIAQPEPGTVAAFSARCTHLGCTVAPAGHELRCPCHGSVYDAGTGAVLHGPAPRALASVPVHVRDGAVLPGSV